MLLYKKCPHFHIRDEKYCLPPESNGIVKNCHIALCCYVNDLWHTDLVLGLTGKELSGEAWVSVLERDIPDHLEKERKAYQASLDEAKKSGEVKEEEPDLNMTIRFVDGDILISDSSENQKGVLNACSEFETYVLKKIANE